MAMTTLTTTASLTVLTVTLTVILTVGTFIRRSARPS